MLVARIITRHPEDALALAAQLRARGYTVETVRPDQVLIHPADFEIELQSCPVEQALARAAQWAEQVGADKVVVGSGALAEEAAASPAPAAFNADEVAAGGRAPNAAAKLLGRGAWQWRAPLLRIAQWCKASARRDTSLDLRVGEEAGPEVISGRSELQMPPRPAADAEAGAVPTGAEDAGSRQLQEERTREAARRPEAEAAPEREREAETARRPPLEAAAEAEQGRAAEQARAVAAAAESGREAAARLRKPEALPRSEAARPYLRFRQREREWRLAVIVATVLAVLLAWGWSAARHPQPAAPLSNSELNHAAEIDQQVPFGPVILHPRAGAAAPVRSATAPAQPSVPRSAKPVPQAKKPEAIIARPPMPKRVRKPSRQATGDDEVVVRHLTAPAKAHVRMNSPVKRYSDLQ